MTTKEVKETSIETIKGEIIDKLVNNMDILKYLRIDRYLEIGYKISNIYNTLIFDHDASAKENDYITVEVEEHEFTSCKPNDQKRYKIIIKMGLEKKKNLDGLALVVKEAIAELYPNRKNYSNVPFYAKASCGNEDKTNVLHRKITFEIDTYMK